MNTKKRNYKKRTNAKQITRRRQLILNLMLIAIIAVALILILFNTVFSNKSHNGGILLSSSTSVSVASPHNTEINVEQNLLTVNQYSRPATMLTSVNGIVIHYTANPDTDAEQNRNYFEGLKSGASDTYASSHFIIGLDGKIIQCIPLDEISYASNDRNYDTISIECCHPDESGAFTPETYNSLVKLTTWLCEEFNLTSQNVIRHYDITGKECPLYFVENEDEWLRFKGEIDSALSV